MRGRLGSGCTVPCGTLKDFRYRKNKGKILGVFIRGHDQICIWKDNHSG